MADFPGRKPETARRPTLRPVRSFVVRGGRLTQGQRRALKQLWPRYGIEPADAPLDFFRLFGNHNPVVLDIGFGNGESTWRMARANPDENLVGVEVHKPGIGHLLLKLEKFGLNNVRIACDDAIEFLRKRVPDASVAGVRLYFPDPWPKKRHHKRRIVQPDFIARLGRKIRPDGVLHIASDWGPYAEHMLEMLEASTAFSNCAPSGGFCSRPEWRPLTKYEMRGRKLGHRVCDLLFQKAGE